MSRKRELALIAAGILAGAALVPTAHAAAQYLCGDSPHLISR